MAIESRARIGRQIALLGGCAAFCAGAWTASAQQGPPPFVNTPPYQLSGAIAPPTGAKITSFDISFVDPARKRYYLASRTSKSIIVVDTTTNTVVGNFAPGFAGNTGNNNTSGPDGVLTTENQLWVGDAPSRVWVLDPNTGAQMVSPISTDPVSQNRADEGCYDPVHKIVAFVNNADDPPFITFISNTTLSIVAKVSFDGVPGTGHGPKATNGAEQCQFNPRDGMIYVTLPEVNGPGDNSAPGAVVAFESTTGDFNVVKTLSIPVVACTGPQGLAIGPDPQLGLGCNVNATNANNAIISENCGSAPIGPFFTCTAIVLAAFPNQGGCDMAWYNPGNNKYFTACRQAPGGEALFVTDAAGFGVQRLFTGTLSNAHSVASDPASFAAYVPTSSAATSGLCSSKGAVDANGCILLYTAGPTSTVTATHDFNGDGNSDILWRQAITGQVVDWLVKGATVIGGGSPGSATTDWAIVGQRDFNGDGFADILWRNSTTGQVLIWLMSDSAVIGVGSPGVMNFDWAINGTGDFNGDGKGDILWHCVALATTCTPGQVLLWFLNGTTVIGMGSPGTMTPASAWVVAGTGDFNGDGFADILWRDTTTNQTMIWLLNGATLLSSGSPGTPPLGWTIVGTGDFNGDHKSDILWQNQLTGQVLIWLISGTTQTGGGSPGSASAPWAIQLTGDFNGDARSDILWRNTVTGTLVLWFVSGTTVIGGGSPGSSALVWQVQTLNAD